MEDVTREDLKILSGLVKKYSIKKLILTLVNMEKPSMELGVLKKEIRESLKKFEDDYRQ